AGDRRDHRRGDRVFRRARLPPAVSRRFQLARRTRRRRSQGRGGGDTHRRSSHPGRLDLVDRHPLRALAQARIPPPPPPPPPPPKPTPPDPLPSPNPLP